MRGSSPLNWALIKDHKIININIIKLNKTIDGGDIIQTKKIKINENTTIKELHEEVNFHFPKMINLLLNKQKKKGLVSIDEHTIILDGLTMEDSPSSQFIESILSRAIQVLPERQKLVFNMRYFDELSYKDIASILEVTEGALKASYHQAVKKIEQFVKGRKVEN